MSKAIQDVEQLFSNGKIQFGIESLNGFLRTHHQSEGGRIEAQAALESSLLLEKLMRCPYTARAKQKPRGYAGDAVMMDYIYGYDTPSTVQTTDWLGEEIFRCTTNSAAAQAVRFRRRLLAEHIDKSCQTPNSKILSVACGHLREADLSMAVREQTFGSFYALDQDEHSLGVVSGAYGANGIETLNAGITALIANRTDVDLSECTLIYASGLYDYLDHKTAVKLTSRLHDLLAVGGTLLLGNFVPDHPDVGYMESVMDWHLVYRDEAELRGVFAESGFSDTVTFMDPVGCIAYGIATKK